MILFAFFSFSSFNFLLPFSSNFPSLPSNPYPFSVLQPYFLDFFLFFFFHFLLPPLATDLQKAGILKLKQKVNFIAAWKAAEGRILREAR